MWVWLLATLIFGGTAAHCEVTTFNLDPNQSSIEIQGTINGFGLNMVLKQQATGSLKARYSGKIAAEFAGTNIQFIGGSRIKPFEIANWEPGPFGAEGSAPASYGLLASVNLGTLTVVGKAASREWQFDVTSAELPLQNGTFASRHLRLPFFDTTNSVLDYHFFFRMVIGDPDFTGDRVESAEGVKPDGSVSAAGSDEITITAAGRHIMSGMLTNRATTPAIITTQNEVRTLVVPVDARYSFLVTNANHQFRFDLIFIGQLVASDAGMVEYTAPTGSGNPIQLSWPAGYKLQRASKLSPPDWEDLALESPIEHPTLQPSEYFRAVKSN